MANPVATKLKEIVPKKANSLSFFLLSSEFGLPLLYPHPQPRRPIA